MFFVKKQKQVGLRPLLTLQPVSHEYGWYLPENVLTEVH